MNWDDFLHFLIDLGHTPEEAHIERLALAPELNPCAPAALPAEAPNGS